MFNPMDLKNKNILITGASSGIGKEISIVLSKLGANVILVARDIVKLKQTFAELEPGNHAIYSFDLLQINNIPILMEDIHNDNYILDGYVHSAGMSLIMPLKNLKYEDIHRIMLVNFYSFLELSRLFSQKKYNNNGGSIVGVSSVSSITASRGYAAYCASKSALDSAVRVLALEFAAHNIRVNTVNPGWIRTEMYDKLRDVLDNETFNNLIKRQPLGLGEPLDVANAVAFLLSDASRFITGTSMVVDGGYLAQ